MPPCTRASCDDVASAPDWSTTYSGAPGTEPAVPAPRAAMIGTLRTRHRWRYGQTAVDVADGPQRWSEETVEGSYGGLVDRHHLQVGGQTSYLGKRFLG